jgi:alpha-beta hydrolase superfamily lysophospholipase
VILAVLVLAFVGGVWYFSSLIGSRIAIDQPSNPFPLTVLSADGGQITYAKGSSDEDELPLMGVATIDGGYVQTSDPSTTGEGTVATTTRAIDKQVLPPPPAVNQAATLDAWFFPRDPKVGLGVDFEDVMIDSPAGGMPAWYIPGSKDTWVIFTHGRAVTAREGLRIASTVTGLGYPMLLISYRDDASAPAEDGRGNFGQTEVPDLEAAVQYALDHGAAKVVLTGASMGAAIDLAFLKKSPLATSVVGAFLDSPASDLGRMVTNGAKDMGVPDFITSAAKTVASWRYGLDWSAVDHVASAGGLTKPMVIVQGDKDTIVPPSLNEQFAAAAPAGLVQYEVFPGAGHVQAWNVDRTRYETLLTDFLAKVAPAASP